MGRVRTALSSTAMGKRPDGRRAAVDLKMAIWKRSG
jgi:hypothetical protein